MSFTTFEKARRLFDEQEQVPAPCSQTVVAIEVGPCDSPWEDHDAPLDTPPF